MTRGLIYRIVLILCIGVSSWFSYWGFLPSFENQYVTIAVVAIIGLVLLGGGITLEEGRTAGNGRRQLFAIILYLSAAVFSGTSNFTHLYSNRMWETVKETGIIEEQEKFAATINAMKIELEELSNKQSTNIDQVLTYYGNKFSKDLDEIKEKLKTSETFKTQNNIYQDLKNKIAQMEQQALDPGRPGCGQRCNTIKKEIDEIVVTTDLRISRSKKLGPELRNSLKNYFDLKWETFCLTDPKFKIYHSVESYVASNRGLICKNDDKIRTKYFNEFFKENDLEAYRNQIRYDGKRTNASYNNYFSALNNFSLQINKRMSELSSISTEYGAITFPKFPSTIDDASKSYIQKTGNEGVIDVASITQVTDLLEKINSEDDLTIPWKGNEYYILKENLHSDVVEKYEPLKTFLTILKQKQEGLIKVYKQITPNSTDEIFSLSLIDTDNGAIGEIPDTVKNGFITMPSGVSTLYAALFGFMIDLLPILFGFLAFEAGEKRRKDDDDDYLVHRG